MPSLHRESTDSLMHHPEKISVSDVFQSTLLTPGRLKPATLRAWGVG